jgi:serine palmitoyltransferase
MEFEQPPLWVLVVMYINYMALYIFGYIADFCRRWNIGKAKVKELLLNSD